MRSVEARGARRRGVASMVPAIVILGLASMFVMIQSQQSSQALLEAERLAADQTATATCRALIAGAFGRLMKAAGDPRDSHHTAMRSRLTAAERETDLSDLVAIAPGELEPVVVGKSRATGAESPVGRVEILRIAARGRHLTPMEGSATDRRGEISVEVVVKVSLGRATVQRSLGEVHELKVLWTGIPQPFDQVAIYLGDLSMVTDARAANRFRDQLLAILDETASSLRGLEARVSPSEKETLSTLLRGLPGQGDRAKTVPALPESPAALLGNAAEREPFALGGLDLAARLQSDLAAVEPLRRDFQQSLASAERDGGKQALAKALDLLKNLKEPLVRMWLYQNVFRVVPHDDEKFRDRIQPYTSHLDPAWFRGRTILKPGAKDPLLAAWQTGSRALHGIFEVESREPVRLTGRLAGSAVLVIRAPALDLTDVEGAGPHDRLTLVMAGGAVRVTGRVRASIVLAGGARIEWGPRAHLTGSLIVPSPAGRLPLEADLQFLPAATDTRVDTGLFRWTTIAVNIAPDPSHRLGD